jgi:uncharacterized protein (TIGR00730 family)
MKKIAVFCGSNSGNNQLFQQKAEELGVYLAQNNLGLVYGGGKVGLMGAVSNSALLHNGHVTGVIPSFMTEKELANEDVTELIIVQSMHERKHLMSEMADGFLVLPGGIGTMDEFFEIFTWRQLGIHNKPIAILDVEFYYTPIIEQLISMTSENFLDKKSLDFVFKTNSIKKAVDFLIQGN